MKREDNRKFHQLRPIKIIRKYLKYPQGSVLIEMGNTRVLCAATVAETVPNFKKNSCSCWVTAEYAMLPASTSQRTPREHRGSGRTHEIQRLIGRSLRAVTDMDKLGERTVYLDCDVIQADGGTRTASITAAWLALYDALKSLMADGKISENPLKEHLAAVSVGIINGEALLDLCYSEDSAAEVDMNVIMTESGKFVEVQGTAENNPFSKQQLDELLEIASKGIKQLISIQKGHLKNK